MNWTMNKINKKLSWILIFSSVLLCSCGSIMKLIVGMPNLNVYTQDEITKNIDKLPKTNNIIDAELANVPNQETIEDFIFKAMLSKSYVFNSNNDLMCFNRNTSCSITELNFIRNQSIDSLYDICNSVSDLKDEGSEHIELNTILSQLEITEDISSLNFDHKILVFLNTDIAKGEIKEEWEYIYESFNKHPKNNVLFIRVWTDLNEKWGLKPNGKAKFKMKKVENTAREFYITLKKLPYKSVEE